MQIPAFPSHLLVITSLSFVFWLSPSDLQAAAPVVLNDSELRTTFHKNATELLKQGQHTSHEQLKSQLSRARCRLQLAAAGHQSMSPAQIYALRLSSVVMVGTLHHCNSATCSKVHATISSGVIIHSDGVILTNHHVVGSHPSKPITMAVMTADGKSFLVDEVLAANEPADIAILKLKNAHGLAATPIFRDEPVGNPVTIISHPAGRFFTLTHGFVSRYAIGPEKAPIMNVTADYARGSSGAPVFNDRGDIIGVVANTSSINYRSVPLAFDDEKQTLARVPQHMRSEFEGQPLALGLSHQLTFKNTTPSSEVLKLIEN